jgi:hypothetical protein
MTGENDVERLAEAAHEAWMREALRQGRHPSGTCPPGVRGVRYYGDYSRCENCRATLVPYGQLPEADKDYDRAMVRAVVEAISLGKPIDTPPEKG